MSRRRGDRSVNSPRHLFVYRILAKRLEIVRVLHDSSDLFRHLPENYLA